MKEGKIDLHEAISLTCLVTVSKILYTTLAATVKAVGTAAWYSVIFSFATALIIFLIVCILMSRFPQKNLPQIFEAVFGKMLGKFINMIFCIYTLYYASMCAREFLEMIKSYTFPRTPPSIILIAFLTVSIIIAYKGLENIARLSYIVFYPILIILALILILTFPYYNFDYLKPVWGYGFKNTLRTGIFRSSSFSEVFILFLIAKSLKSTEDVKKAGIISLIIIVIMPSITYVVYLMVFGYARGSEPLSGMFELSKLIYFNRYFQRVESFFLFIWVISALINVSTAFYMSIFIYSNIFNIKNHKPIILQFAFLMYMIALIPKNITELTETHILFLRQYSFIIVYGIPVFALLVSIIFGKKEQISNGKKA